MTYWSMDKIDFKKVVCELASELHHCGKVAYLPENCTVGDLWKAVDKIVVKLRKRNGGWDHVFITGYGLSEDGKIVTLSMGS